MHAVPSQELERASVETRPEMTDPQDLTNDELDASLQKYYGSINTLVELVRTSPKVKEAMRQIMESGGMLEECEKIGVSDPQLAKLIARSSLASFVSILSAKAIEAEQKRRAGLN